ncbi:MAG: squalene--hopene cyclase [Bacteroidia bacterium]|nr:squalene--hopene cyclase [Bacteroidia bacterium]
MEQKNLENQFTRLVRLLKSERNAEGFWSGRLASSALATAVAIVALKINKDKTDNYLILNGLDWLLNNINVDGGFGDTPDSKSNVSTSLLCFAAISYCGKGSEPSKKALLSIEKYLLQQKIDLTKGNVTTSVLSFYGNDFTFSVPILSMLIICGVLDEKVYSKIPQLPFEFTLFPASWYSLFNLRVVSYAIPALIAVGIFIFKKRNRHNRIMRWIRNRSIQPALRKLEKIVPESGGFLEAIPLTAFVEMCLISSGFGDNPVVEKGLSFLRIQQRPDGSWPIDTDLSTWVTTLSVKALGSQMSKEFSASEINALVTHLKTIQYKDVHPFNLAQPGGWGWTNFSGSVPDVDDTSGAILALVELYHSDIEDKEAIINGCQWLATLQNKDGGYPTFCKGWGKLPFDSSCADLTGHALLALAKSLDILGDKMTIEFQNTVKQCIARAFGFLWKVQNDNGSWFPLWFGNQFTPENKNYVYGTAKVAIYLKDSLLCNSLEDHMKRNIRRMLSDAQEYLLKQQNADGSWGGELDIPGTIEESSLAISALIGKDQDAILKGFEWIENEYDKNGMRSNPIGLYFAMLWYDEKLYPLIYYIEALRRYLE